MAVYTSPKRKRDAPERMTTTTNLFAPDDSEHNGYENSGRSSLELKIDFPAEAPPPGPLQQRQQVLGNGSPGGKVTTQFEGLRLMEEGITKLDWGRGIHGSPNGEASIPAKRPKQMNAPDYGDDTGSEDVTGVNSRAGQTNAVELRQQKFPILFDSPVRSPSPTERINGDGDCIESTREITYQDQEKAAEDASPESREAASPIPPPRSLSKSPPLLNHSSDNEEISLTWQEYEITGQNADDPDDDGEGINGIGFKPTTAMADARAERRRQQVQEYKSREAREARKARSDRRTREKGVERALEKEHMKRKVRFT